MVAGIGRVLDAVERFRFDDDVLGVPARARRRRRARRWTGSPSYRFCGDVWGYPEGEVYFPGSPLLVVEATFAEAVLLETLLLSILNHDSAIAVGRVPDDVRRRRPPVHRDGLPAHPRGGRRRGRPGGVRRRLRVARPTSPPAARYGIPTAGTSAHAFTLLHDTERDAFTAQVESLGAGTTLLVDTYDVAEAVRIGVEVAGPDLGAVRIDSGDLLVLAARGPARSSTTLGATRHADRRDLRPRRVRHRRARGRAGRRATASAPRW